MNSSTKKLCEGTISDALTPAEIDILKEIMQITRAVCKKETTKDPAFLLIGMRALYYYFGKVAFNPSLISVEIDLNYDILMDWAPFRHKIPNQIKNRLEPLGYQVKPGIGVTTILKRGLLIDLTLIFEHKEQIIGAFIPELQIHAADMHYLIYSKLSRGDPIKDLSRLKCLFKNCREKIDLDIIFRFAYPDELETIQARVKALL